MLVWTPLPGHIQAGGDAWYPEAWSTEGCVQKGWNTGCCIIPFFSQKMEKNKIVRNFLTKIKIDFCIEFYTGNVF